MTSLQRRLRQRLIGAAARGVLFVLALLPDRAGLGLGAALGRLFGRVSGRRAWVARVNLRIAFPEWSEERRRSVMRESFANLGRSLAELARIRRLPPEALCERTRIEGLEHLETARLASRTGGVIGLTGHFGNWELLATSMAARGLPVTLVYRPRDNPHLEQLVTGWRERCGLVVVPRGSAARAVLRALRVGRIAALPLDQDTPRRDGIFVPFFQRLACTRDGPARIAMRTGAPVVPVFIFRVAGGPRHVVRVAPPLALVEAGEDREAAIRENVRRMNRAIEEAIRSAPDQWTWSHRRWRIQPPGDPPPYRSWRRRGPLGALRTRSPARKIPS